MSQFLISDDIVYDKTKWASRLVDITNMDNYKTVRKNLHTVEYINIPASFDIETSSFYIGIKKCACMYIWSCNINGVTFIGRTWEDFLYLISCIEIAFETSPKLRLMMWVHNLEYEFQFMGRWLEWFTVFSDDERKPIYAVTKSGIEFRCSYKLSGYSLENLSSQLLKYKTEKMVGDLDYSLIRHSKTPLSEKEMKYVIQDTKVVVCYIQEQIEKEHSIAEIPYTKTGYVRRFCRNMTVGNTKNSMQPMISDNSWKYHNIIKGLTLTPEEYLECKRAFQGGFTHANARHVNQILDNVGSIDFTSSYPAWCVLSYMPMSSPRHVKITSMEHFQNLIKFSCCMFDVKFYNIKQIDLNETPISLSKCRNVKDELVNNGRVVKASQLETTLTELDFDTIRKFYKWDSMSVANFLVFRKSYLPKELVNAILTLYEQKTTLKGVDGREFDYLLSKAMLNACYGMMVTDIVRDNAEFDMEQGWSMSESNPASQLERYNNNFSRFLYYPWGIWVTAHARHNLFQGIKAFGDDYVYSDTDSIKALNMDKHMDFVTKWNDDIIQEIKLSAFRNQLPESMYMPKTIKGIVKPIGQWDYEGVYDKFKTLGAKRYVVQKNNELTFTVAGIKKKSLKEYMEEKFITNEDILEEFTDQLDIPADRTGKLTHTYCDEEISGGIKDYLGEIGYYHEKSYIHLEPAPFHMNIIDEYKDYINGIRSREK